MRAVLLLALFATVPAVAQPALVARAGVGLDVGADVGKLASSGSLGVASGGWAAGLHVERAEEIAIFTSPAERSTTVALLVGREVRPTGERGYLVVWAGPSVVQAVERGEVVESGWFSSRHERVDRLGIGAAARVSASAFPVPRVPIGLSLDAGVSASHVGLAASGTLGLAVRLGG